jgi:hypothetical protein
MDTEQKPEQWISVKERLPENNDEILVYSTTLEAVSVRKLKPYACYYFEVFKAYHSDSQAWLSTITITHWMPLPKPPESLLQKHQPNKVKEL